MRDRIGIVYYFIIIIIIGGGGGGGSSKEGVINTIWVLCQPLPLISRLLHRRSQCKTPITVKNKTEIQINKQKTTQGDTKL